MGCHHPKGDSSGPSSPAAPPPPCWNFVFIPALAALQEGFAAPGGRDVEILELLRTQSRSGGFLPLELSHPQGAVRIPGWNWNWLKDSWEIASSEGQEFPLGFVLFSQALVASWWPRGSGNGLGWPGQTPARKTFQGGFLSPIPWFCHLLSTFLLHFHPRDPRQDGEPSSVCC